ncbi:MAG: metallophosphoesterase [Hyphomicrobiaceae bacterium]
MRIAHLSDTHIQAANPNAKSRIDDLARAVDSINGLSVPPDVVLHSGDIAHDATPEDYAAARAELMRLKAPLYTTIGNRDRRNPYFEAFVGDGYLDPGFGFAQYAVDLDAIYLVAVDTQYRDTEKGGLGGFCPARAENLDALLAAANGKPTLVFAHHPPVELADSPKLQFREAPEAALLCECLQRHDALVALLAGHVHRTHVVPFGDVTLSTIPSIAADLSREKATGGEVGETHTRRPIYQIHTWAKGKLITSAVTLERSGRVPA